MKKTIFTTIGIIIVSITAVSIRAEDSATTLNDSLNRVEFDQSHVKTGKNSKAELSNSSATFKLGSNSSVGIRSKNKTLDLQKGVMMVSTTRKGLRRESVNVETDQIRATTNATMLISYQPGRYIKIACTGGRVDVKLKSLARESVTIRKGQMLIINCLENVLPAAVSVDMNQLMATSPLLAPGLRGRPGGNPPLATGVNNNGANPPPAQAPPPAPQQGQPPAPPQQAQQAIPRQAAPPRPPAQIPASRPRAENRPERRMPSRKP